MIRGTVVPTPSIVWPYLFSHGIFEISTLAIRSLDASSKKLVMAARDKVYADWFSYYANRGIPVDVASEKVGNTMLILPAIQVIIL